MPLLSKENSPAKVIGELKVLSTRTQFGIFLLFVKNVRIIAVIKVFTIGFNGENGFFSDCKKFNVEICVKLGKILMSITMKITKLKRIISTV